MNKIELLHDIVKKLNDLPENIGMMALKVQEIKEHYEAELARETSKYSGYYFSRYEDFEDEDNEGISQWLIVEKEFWHKWSYFDDRGIHLDIPELNQVAESLFEIELPEEEARTFLEKLGMEELDV